MAADHKWPHEAWKFDEQWHESKMKALVPSLPTGAQTKHAHTLRPVLQEC